jgi:hypothetical protein
MRFLSTLAIVLAISLHFTSLSTTNERSKLFSWKFESSVAFVLLYAFFKSSVTSISKNATLDWTSNLFATLG